MRMYTGPLASRLPPLRLVSGRTQEYAGACPFCGGDHRLSDRFHIWLAPPGNERFWCRQCGRKGRLDALARELGATPLTPDDMRSSESPIRDGPQPNPDHIPHYRRIYDVVMQWAEEQLHEPLRSDPKQYLRKRGFDDDTIRVARLGYAVNDADALVRVLERHDPDLLHYAEEAGVCERDERGRLRTHRVLRGKIVIPYLHHGIARDLRMRMVWGKGYFSLPGGYHLRGAIVPYGWDAVDGNEIVIITEGEFKALAVNAAYARGLVPAPAIAHPGLSYFRREWGRALRDRGVAGVVLCYDSRAVRPRDIHGVEQLTPEEQWTLTHGEALRRAGLRVYVLSLPVPERAEKEDLDGFLLRHGPDALTDMLRTAPVPLHVFRERLPTHLAEPALAAA